jgi:hypothetical protein
MVACFSNSDVRSSGDAHLRAPVFRPAVRSSLEWHDKDNPREPGAALLLRLFHGIGGRAPTTRKDQAMRIRFRDGPQHIVDHIGVLKKDEQSPTRDDEAARCRQVLASRSASEATKLKALSTLYRLRYGG